MGPKARRSTRARGGVKDEVEDAPSPPPARSRTPKRSRKVANTPQRPDEEEPPISLSSASEARQSASPAVHATVSGNTHAIFEDNLEVSACRDRIRVLHQRNEELEQQAAFMRSDVRLNLESQVESFRAEMEAAITAVSESIVKQTCSMTKSETKPKGPKAQFPRKVFIPRESPLSKMLQYDDENYKTLFNIGVVCLVLWGAAMVLDDIDKFGFPNFDLLMWGVVNDLEPFFRQWFLLFAMSFSVIPVAHAWAERRRTITGVFLGAAYVALQIWMFTFSATVVFSGKDQLAMPLAMGFMVEQTRMSMKMHSYLREKVLWSRFNAEYACKPISALRLSLLDFSLPDMNYFFGEATKFAFFLFVPTLLFREKYPRTLRIRWSYVFQHGIECIAIVYYSFLIYRAVLPQFHEGSDEPTTWKAFVRYSFKCMGPAMATMVIAHYLVLHSIQHLGAELTRFADRGFYQDWWNARTFSVFYRKWNGVVHDFIHSYMYMDMVELLHFGKLPALLLSFLISAVVHEYLICVAMGFFLPVLGILFTGPGLIFILLTKNKTGRIWNAFMWMMLAIGNGWLMVLYAREYFARQTVLAEPVDPWEDFFVPRTFKIQFPQYFS